MKFIHLHLESGSDIMVNFDRVDAIQPAKLHSGTIVSFQDDEYINVRETITEILLRLDK